MQRNLGEIANFKYGPFEKGAADGEAKYIVASHFDDHYRLTKFDKSYIDLDDRTSRFLLKQNDVILAAKGQRLFAWAYQSEFGKIVPSSLFYIIKTNPKLILGEYLAYFLNSEKLQHELNIIGGSVTVPSIPKKELSQLKIHIPSIEEQKRIIAMVNLIDQNINLTEKILDRKRTLKRGLINKMITHQSKNIKISNNE